VGACARSQKVCATRSVATSRKTRTPWTNTLVRVLLQWELSFFAPPRRKGVESRVESAVAFDSVALSACASPLSRGSHPQARRFSCACLRVIKKKIKTSVRFRSNKNTLVLLHDDSPSLFLLMLPPHHHRSYHTHPCFLFVLLFSPLMLLLLQPLVPLPQAWRASIPLLLLPPPHITGF